MNDIIPIAELPNVQLTTLMKSNDKNSEKYIQYMKKEILNLR